ncbi:PEP-CTERM sorting domain-containing protein [Gloeothece verrucosa]|uniref:PEP-CTERM protein-sorting domain-containing protein n=1 Tax=Gloeothece verrucosa (strain PCC 7822) TaxID=497965 RepID=E0UC87_GLOV7|nr:PEP-CTERM sorting domain-containing protein [Gloeothece verrucosa]ADN12844.1 hypothetical protein Cyan7822_0818 [Gloeothece verrucosa PCC 7822]
MNKLSTQLALSTVGTIIASSIVYLGPAQAAAFKFYIDPENSSISGDLKGSLSFDQEKTNLTGVGFEQATLSQLPEAKFNFKFRSDVYIANGYLSKFNLSEPTFYFNSGNLVGININGFSDAVQLPSAFPKNYAGEFPVFFGSGNFSISGDYLIEQVAGNVDKLIIATDAKGRLIAVNNLGFEPYNFDGQGQVIFQAVPEPMTILGSATAIGFSLFFRRKPAKK